MTVGVRIKAARESKGLTQTDLAAKLGVTMMTVSRWERGVGSLTVLRVQEIAEELGVSPSELLIDNAASAA